MEKTPNEFRSNIGSFKENVQQSLEESGWTDRYHTVQAKAREAVDASEEFVKEHPFYTVLGAATVGFVAGMLLRRRQ